MFLVDLQDQIWNHSTVRHVAREWLLCIWIFFWLLLVIARKCISTDINFPKVCSRQVVDSIIMAIPAAANWNYPVIPATHICCVVVQTILFNTMADMSPLTMICPSRTILSQSWVITIHTDEGVARVWLLISFTAEISHHFRTFFVQSRSDVECCSFFLPQWNLIWLM